MAGSATSWTAASPGAQARVSLPASSSTAPSIASSRPLRSWGFAWYLRATPYGGFLASAAICGSLLVSYAQARGETVGVNRTGGLMRRAERLVLTCLVCLLDRPLTAAAGLPPGTAVVWVLGLIAVTTSGPPSTAPSPSLASSVSPLRADPRERPLPRGWRPAARPARMRVAAHARHPGGHSCPNPCFRSRNASRNARTSTGWRSTSASIAVPGQPRVVLGRAGEGARLVPSLAQVSTPTTSEVDFAWYSGGRLNACLQLRRPHLEPLGDQPPSSGRADEPGVYATSATASSSTTSAGRQRAARARRGQRATGSASTCR
jgi:hypothetical protein